MDRSGAPVVEGRTRRLVGTGPRDRPACGSELEDRLRCALGGRRDIRLGRHRIPEHGGLPAESGRAGEAELVALLLREDNSRYQNAGIDDHLVSKVVISATSLASAERAGIGWSTVVEDEDRSGVTVIDPHTARTVLDHDH